ncbi:homocysteine S-methyltransferase family protein [Luteitalea sp.]|uniref:homocysteine S-methyltransferase family protein n=1 Tax=Luteitalea sp. TaxID=2004800 RepID=UPI0025BC41B9|nr:homocysteine S-methyltransferase family protein [Luteitalea sp.]
MSPLSQPLITLLSSLTARSETAPCLRAAGVVITDGAWGTQLQARGLPPGTCPDTWNLSHPDLVEQVPRAYVEAGSRIVLTNTFRANRLALADHGVTDSVEAINRAGVEISRRATGGRALVFASIGPSGRLLLAGTVTEEELMTAFDEQARALAAAGADALVVETMADLDEARIAVVAAKATGLPVVACMVFDSGADQDRTMMGTTPEDAARALEAAGADVIGANCGQGIEGYVGICRRLVNATDRPVWIKANAGVPTLVDGEAVYATSPAQFASASRAVVDAGARFIGGCCGTTPEFIRALAREIGS